MLNRKALLTALLVPALALAGASQAVAQERGGIAAAPLYGDPARFDPHKEAVLAVQDVIAGIFSSLLQWDPSNPKEIVPDLALSYDVSPNKLVYTFKLRPGVKWHDGQPFSAEDVKATFDRIIKPDFRSPRCGAMMKPLIKQVEVVDPLTVRFTLKTPAVTFITATASAWCRIIPKHILERDGDFSQTKSLIGTGPFKFARYERGSVVEWERNPNYYDSRYPYLDGVKFFVLRGNERLLAAARAGRIYKAQAWPGLTPQIAYSLRDARGDEINMWPGPLNNLGMLLVNSSKPPFDKRDMRRAVHLAIDRHETFEKLYDGIGAPCQVLDQKVYGDFGLPAEEVLKLPGCRKDKTEDIAEAKRLVAKHYPNGVDVEVAVRAIGNFVQRTELAVADLRKVGIRGKIRTYDSASGIAAYRRGDFTLIGSQDLGMYMPDPSAPFGLFFVTGGGFNVGKWSNPTLDKLAEQALREHDRAKRIELYHRMQRIVLTEDAPGAVIGGVYAYFFTDKKLKGYKPGPTMFDNGTFMKVWLNQ